MTSQFQYVHVEYIFTFYFLTEESLELVVANTFAIKYFKMTNILSKKMSV